MRLRRAVRPVPVLGAGGQDGVRRLGRGRPRPGRRPAVPGGPEPAHPGAGAAGRVRPGRRRELAEYTSYYARLYAAIAEVSGAELVIDSSKHPSLAHCLRWQDGVDLRVLHLVRDSRAVAYSWGRQVRRPDTDRESYMTRYSPAVAAAQWNGQNAAFHLLRGVPVLRMRYEDFVAAPEAAVRRIAALRRAAGRAGYSFLGADGGARLGRAGARAQRVGQPDAVHHRPDRDQAGRAVAGRACRRRSGGRSPR